MAWVFPPIVVSSASNEAAGLRMSIFHFRTIIHVIGLPVFVLALTGCGGVSPVWKGTCEELKESKTLYYQQPCEYQFSTSELLEQGPYSLEFTLTYYSQIGRSELPLFVVLEDDQHNTQEFNFSIQIKKDGRDLGTPAQNEIDLTVTHLAAERLALDQNMYFLRVFYDGERLMEAEAEGIIALEARLYNSDSYVGPPLP